jgi:hypothetical protein
MAKAKSKSKTDSQAQLSPAQPERRRIAQYQDNIRISLTPEERHAAARAVGELHREIGRLEGSLKSTKDEIKGKISDAETRMESKLLESERGWREERGLIEEWLTSGNEVEIVNVQTGEIIRRRNATADELQESLPGVVPTEDPPEDGDGLDDGEDDGAPFGGGH